MLYYLGQGPEAAECFTGGQTGSVLLFLGVGTGRLSVRKLDIDVADVRRLIELVEKYNLEELTVAEDDVSITVKGRAPQAMSPVILQTGGSAAHAEALHAHEEEHVEEDGEEEADGDEAGIVDIVSPLVGVFYRAPAPDSPSFVEVGDVIEVGMEIGLIEAMKVFSPIPSEVAGEVVDIRVQNATLVQQGQVLMRVRVPEERG
jgi:acetyl-CoA carboxylase biotin carboxyl carrier protein